MDQVKIGKFIAELRRRDGLTQNALGEKIGVTNKTISRWENGNYMPDIEMLQLLAVEFRISIDELLAGERIADGDFGQKADKHSADVFSLEERKAYFKRKWRKEHGSLFLILMIAFAASVVLPFALDRPYLAGMTPLVALVGYGYLNNKMMSYVERNIYERRKGLDSARRAIPKQER